MSKYCSLWNQSATELHWSFLFTFVLSTRRDYLKNKRVAKSENFQFKTIIIGFKLMLILNINTATIYYVWMCVISSTLRKDISESQTLSNYPFYFLWF